MLRSELARTTKVPYARGVRRLTITPMSTLRCLAAVALVALVAGAAAPAVGGDSSLEAIRARGVLRVGVQSHGAPFGSLDTSGRPVGFEIDIARLLVRVLFDDDRRVEFTPVTTATRFGVLQSGRVDLVIATLTVTEERRSLAELSAPYFMSAALLLVRQSSTAEGLGDLAGKRVGIIKGSVQERDVAELQSRAELVSFPSFAVAVQAVKSGAVEAFVYDDVVLLSLAARDAAFRVAGQPIAPRPFAIAARKGEIGLIRWVDGWLAKMRRDGTYGELWHRYFAPFESRLVGG